MFFHGFCFDCIEASLVNIWGGFNVNYKTNEINKKSQPYT